MRLDSWKEIAAYLRRDIKTVQRWERRHRLPVHRLQHDKLGSVYAFRDQLDAWMEGRSHANGGEPGGTELLARESDVCTDETGATEPPPDRRTFAPPRESQPADAGFRRWQRVSLGLVALAAIAGLSAWRWSRHDGSTANAETPVRFLVDAPPNAFFAGTLADPEPTVSPDGRFIVFRAAERDSGRQRLYLRSLERSASEVLEGTEGAQQPFWSPDSRRLAFFADGALKRIDLDTRRVVSLARAAQPGGGAWLPSNAVVFNPDAGEGLHLLEPDGGAPRPLTFVERGQGQTRHVAPEVAADGSRILYLADYDDPARHTLWVTTQRPGDSTWVANVPRMGRVAPGGWFLYFLGARLVAQRLDLRAPALVGSPRGLEDTLDRDDATSQFAGFSVSSNGVLAYWPVTRAPLARLTWFDRQGREIGTVGPPGDYPFVSLSPDADRAAVQRVDDLLAAPDVWLHDFTKGTSTRLTAAHGNDENPVWSPDGAELVYARHASVGASAELRRLRTGAPLADAPVAARRIGGHPTDWSRDGSVILIQVSRPKTNSDLLSVRVADGSTSAVADSPFNERHGRFSPDMRFVAYSSDISGRLEVYVKSLGPDAAIAQVSTGGGSHPRWRSDGRELFYLAASGVITAVPTTVTPAFSAGRPTPLFDARPPLPLVFLDTLYDVTPDGQRFLVGAAERPATTVFTVAVGALRQLQK